MKKSRFAALALAGAMALSVLAGPAAAVTWPEKEHLPVDYADMVYTGFDDDAIQEAFAGLAELDAAGALIREDPDTRKRVEELYTTIVREYDRLETQCALIDLRRDADLTDEWAAGESADCADRLNYTADQCYGALSLLSGTPYADIPARDAGMEWVESLSDYEPMTEEEAGLLRREEELVQKYETAIMGPFPVTDDRGRTWTREDLYEDVKLTDEDYYDLLEKIEQAENAAVGPIFVELVEIRNRLARLWGYDNYAEYAYEGLWGRDYRIEDVAAVRGRIREELLELYNRILELAGEEIYALDSIPAAAGEEILEALAPYMEELSPQLGETFRFLREHHLYDLEVSPVKNGVGYTVALPAYGTAFIFDSPYGDIRDWSTVVHEFGHFNETFHAAGSDLWNGFFIDVGEVHSQGLEVLFTRYAQELFGENGRGFVWKTLLDMVESVLEGCMYDEFQTRIYAEPDMTLEEINRLFGQLSRDYGYSGEEDTSYFWVEIPHNFSQPMYYISYAASALSALELYLLSLEDWDRAVDTYLELSAMGMTVPYREAMEQVGLGDIFDRGTVRELSRDLEECLERDYGREKAEEPDSSRGVILALLAVIFILQLLLVWTGVLLYRSKRQVPVGADLRETGGKGSGPD